MSYSKSPNSLPQSKPSFSDVLSFLRGKAKDSSLSEIPSSFSFPNPHEKVDERLPTASWINHSTFLVEAGNLKILTDPIWSNRCSPVCFLGPKRHFEPPLSLDELPKIDVVLLSHNHYDHLDKKAVRALHKRFPEILWIVPKGVKKWLVTRLWRPKVVELAWGEETKFDELVILATPAQHFSGRSLWDRNKTQWMGCLVNWTKTKKRLYFAGDTGYNSLYFNEIGKLGEPDLSLLPIGAYRPRDFMKFVHIDPEEAVTIHEEVRSKLSIAGHFGTFKLSYESLDQPPYDLYQALKQRNISCEKFRVLTPGQKINW